MSNKLNCVVYDNNEIISVGDFTSILNDYLAVEGSFNWNGGRCDFDRHGQVESVNYSLFAINYGKTSPQT